MPLLLNPSTLTDCSKRGIRVSSQSDLPLKKGEFAAIDNIGEEWPRFVTETCPSASKILGNHPSPMRTMTQHKSRRDKFSVWNMKGPSAKALCYLHAMDYACFDELPHGVHKLCKEIYSSDNFRLEMESK